MTRSLTVILAFLLIAGMTFIVTSRAPEAQAASQKQPHLDEAYRLLRRCDKAIQYIDAAIVQLQAAIQEPPCS